MVCSQLYRRVRCGSWHLPGCVVGVLLGALVAGGALVMYLGSRLGGLLSFEHAVGRYAGALGVLPWWSKLWLNRISSLAIRQTRIDNMPGTYPQGIEAPSPSYLWVHRSRIGSGPVRISHGCIQSRRQPAPCLDFPSDAHRSLAHLTDTVAAGSSFS